MNFVQDFKVKDKQEIDDEFKLNVKASFYLAYLDQISDKLNYTMEELEIEDLEDKTKKNKIIRCSMKMITPPSNLKIDRIITKNKAGHEDKISINEEDFINKDKDK